MEQLLYFLPALACPLGMGLMMWLMMRGTGHGTAKADTAEQERELAALRAQVEALQARDRQLPGPTGSPYTTPYGRTGQRPGSAS